MQPHHTTSASMHHRLRERSILVVVQEQLVRLKLKESYILWRNVNPQVFPQLHTKRDPLSRVLHELFHPYHLQSVQALNSEKYPHRFSFCQWFLDHNFARIVSFSDEACLF